MCLGYWDFPLDELEAFGLKFSWLCNMCWKTKGKAESKILPRSNPNFLLFIEIHHAAPVVVVCSVSLPKNVWSRWWLPLPRVQKVNGGNFQPPGFPAETNPQHWCGCY